MYFVVFPLTSFSVEVEVSSGGGSVPPGGLALLSGRQPRSVASSDPSSGPFSPERGFPHLADIV